MKKLLCVALALAISSAVSMQALIFDHYHDDYYDGDYYDDGYRHHGVVSGAVEAADDVADAGLEIVTLGGWGHRHDRRDDRRYDNDNRRDHRD